MLSTEHIFPAQAWRRDAGDVWRPTDENGEVEALQSSSGVIEIRCAPRMCGHVLIDLGDAHPRLSLSRGEIDAIAAARPLNPSFVASWLASALATGAQDHFAGSTPLRNVYAVGRGCTARIDLTARTVATTFTPRRMPADVDGADLEALKRNVQSVLHDEVAEMASSGAVIAECSGGIDSSIACRAAHLALGARFRAGLYVAFASWEFRREVEFARSCAAFSNFKLHEAEGAPYEPWAFLAHAAPALGVWFPSMQLPSLGQVIAAADVAVANGAGIVLTGHGGDLALATPSSMHAPAQRLRLDMAWLTPAIKEAIQGATHPLQTLAGSVGLVESGLQTDNPWLNLASQRLRGVGYRSIFWERRFAAALNDAAQSSKIGTLCMEMERSGVQRPLAHLLFEGWFAPKIAQRRWKVNHLGLQFRAWARHGSTFEAMLRRHEDYWRDAGVEPRKMRMQVKQMREGKQCDDRAINALLPLAYWLDSYAGGFRAV